MHVPRAAELAIEPAGSIRLRIEPGNGSAPDVDAALHPSEMPGLTGPWKECFADFRGFLGYCVPQDRALSSQPWYGRITRQEIQLGIPLEACEPLTGDVHSRAARAIAGDTAPICFRVPQVAFRYDGEEYDYRA